MAKPKAAPVSPWSIKIASVAGIPIRLHITFLLLLAFIAQLAYREESRVFALILPSVFVCVILHELGHALVAKAFGVGTRDITLYPIGGVALLEKRPKPFQELWIALAGPAVNVVIAGILLAIQIALVGSPPSLAAGWSGATYLEGLFAANISLVLFNMVPAFPMDGGRVLRALLALNMPEVKATKIAGTIGQFLAIGLAFYGLTAPHLMLVLIAFFVFMGAGQEVQASVGLSLLEGRKVGEAMMTRYGTIEHGTTLGEAAKVLLEGSQTTFPVVNNAEVIGFLDREGIIKGLSEEGPDAYVAGFMNREFDRYETDEPLEKVLENGADGLPALVYDNDKLVGILSAENIGEFLLVRQALGRT